MGIPRSFAAFLILKFLGCVLAKDGHQIHRRAVTTKKPITTTEFSFPADLSTVNCPSLDWVGLQDLCCNSFISRTPFPADLVKKCKGKTPTGVDEKFVGYWMMDIFDNATDGFKLNLTDIPKSIKKFAPTACFLECIFNELKFVNVSSTPHPYWWTSIYNIYTTSKYFAEVFNPNSSYSPAVAYPDYCTYYQQVQGLIMQCDQMLTELYGSPSVDMLPVKNVTVPGTKRVCSMHGFNLMQCLRLVDHMFGTCTPKNMTAKQERLCKPYNDVKGGGICFFEQALFTLGDAMRISSQSTKGAKTFEEVKKKVDVLTQKTKARFEALKEAAAMMPR